jgi:hypothetical protein
VGAIEQNRLNTIGSQMAAGLTTLCAGRANLHRNIFWFSFLLEAESRAIVRLEGLDKLKKKISYLIRT